MRHSLVSILALAAAAVAAGAQSFTAIGEWAADAPQRVLARLGTRFDPRRDRHIAPDEATMRRVLCDIDGDDLDAAISGWITTTADIPPAIAVDGKALRGTFPRAGGAGVHLLSVLTHRNGTVLAQQQVTAHHRNPARARRPRLPRHRPGSSRSPATAPTALPAPATLIPATASPACPQTPARPPLPPTCAVTGKPKTGCTGSATSHTGKTPPASAPAPVPSHGHPAQPGHQRPAQGRPHQRRSATAHGLRHHPTTHPLRNHPMTSTTDFGGTLGEDGGSCLGAEAAGGTGRVALGGHVTGAVFLIASAGSARSSPSGSRTPPSCPPRCSDSTGTITFAGAEDRRRRRNVHIDRSAERDLVLRAISHAHRVHKHVRRARDSAGDAPAE
ncbi:transposase family protein [Amycolatopsis sp. NPDC024027]|uniref:transposase family protein n=1 Tax=Amycolatopsis sp. NPDC024027 TaxID=3154327 RepID=UPI0034119B78